MGKIVLLFASLLFNINQNDFQYQEQIIPYEIIEEVDDYQVIKDETLKLVYEHETLYEFSNDCVIKLIKTDQHLIVTTITNGILSIKAFDRFNRLVKEVQLPGKFVNEFDIECFQEKIIIVGGITKYEEPFLSYKKPYFFQTDAFICQLNSELEVENIKIYGGKLDEYFSSIEVMDDNLYITGKKSTLSGGDFGNGGGKDYGYLYAKFNANLILQHYGTLKEKIHHLKVYDNDVYLLCENNIYHLNHLLEYDYSIPLPKQITYGIMTFHKLAILFSDEIQILYLDNQNILTQIELFPYQSVKAIDDGFFFKTNDEYKLITIYDLRDFIDYSIYDGNKINQTINNLFREIPLSNTVSSPSFNPLVYGEYKIDYFYQQFKVTGIVKVPLEANVSEGFIYPIGYHLLFTGNAYLDGELVMNNHAVQKQGNHQLVLYGCDGSEKIINFKIDKDQIPFTEYQDKDWDLETYPLHDFNLVIHHPFTDYQITNLIINNENYLRFTKNPQELIIHLQESIPGIYQYHLQEATFLINNQEIKKVINYHFKVNVLKNSLEVESQFLDDAKHLFYEALVADPEAEIRGINVKVVGGSEELYYHFPISDRPLLLTGLNVAKQYQCTINLTLNEGNGILKDFALFSFDIIPNDENIRLGEINIIQKGLTLEKFKIIIKKNPTIPMISLDNKIIYQYQKPNDTKIIIYSVATGLIFCTFIYIFKKSKRKIS